MTETASGKFALPEWEDIKSVREQLGPEGWLKLGAQRSGIAREETNKLNDFTYRVLNGDVEREIKAKIEATENQIKALIDGIGSSFKDPTASSMEEELDLEIRTLESMQPWTLNGLPESDLRGLDPERLAMQKDPATGQFYTQEQWQKIVSKAKRDKESKLTGQGAKIDPYEAAASFIFQLIDPESADVIASVPEKLRQQKMEVYRSQKVRDFEADQKQKMAQLQFYSTKYSNLQDLYRDELRRVDSWAGEVYKNEQDWKKLNFQAEQGKWSDALSTANDILNNLQKLPAEMIKENLNRYNIMANYVNTVEGKPVMKIYSDQEVDNVYRDAKRRRTAEIVKTIMDSILPMRMKWEIAGTTPEQNDIKYINDLIKSYGPLYDANTGQDRVFTVDDLGILRAFNRNTPATETKQEEIKSRERMNEDDNQTKKDIASESNKSKERIAESKGTSTDKEVKKWQDALTKEEVKYNGLYAKYQEAIGKAMKILNVKEIPEQLTPAQIFKLKRAGLFTQLFDVKSGLGAQIKESEAKMAQYQKYINDPSSAKVGPPAPKGNKGSSNSNQSAKDKAKGMMSIGN